LISSSWRGIIAFYSEVSLQEPSIVEQLIPKRFYLLHLLHLNVFILLQCLDLIPVFPHHLASNENIRTRMGKADVKRSGRVSQDIEGIGSDTQLLASQSRKKSWVH